MKPLKFFLLLLPIVLGSASLGPSETLGNRIAHSNKVYGNQALLEYVGNLSGMFGFNIGIQVAIDTTIGVRYEVTFEKGTAVTSHIAIFYKFSSPFQSITYNFLTHKSTVNKNGGSPDSDPNVEVIGNATVGNYLCTHLQHGGGTNEVSDYWMSPNVPGFSKLVNTLKTISPDLPALAFSGTIFNWGGLVKWTENFVAEGESMHMELHLKEANTDIRLPSKTFEVPSQIKN
jgi:hypothetical protein